MMNVSSKADLGLFVTSGNGSTPYRIHPVTKAWTNSATWNTTNGSTAWTAPGGDFDSTMWVERTAPAANEYRRWFPTGIVRDWVNGKPNHGFLLKQATESTSNVLTFASKENSDSTRWPFLEVNYVRRLGELPSYRFWDFDLTDRMQARVNVANGNLLIKASDFTVPGTGLNLVVDRYYNGYEDRNVTKADSGWRFSIPTDARLTIFPSDGSVRYEGITGYKVPFIKRADGSFESPPGIDAKLTQSGSTYALKFNKSEETYNFDSAGRWTSHVDRDAARATRLFGTEEWKRIYELRRDPGSSVDGWAARRAYLNLLRWRLKDLGYKWTMPLEFRNLQNRPVYEMIFATAHEAGERIMRSLYGRAEIQLDAKREDALAHARGQPRLFALDDLSVEPRKFEYLEPFPPDEFPRVVY
jgi:uncharacterized protein DUF6531